MDQQRKVIDERRLQIIDGDDLEEHTEDLLAGACEKLVAEHCPSESDDASDLKALVDGLRQHYPMKFTPEDLAQAVTTRTSWSPSSKRLWSTTRSTPSPCRAGPRRCARSSATSTCNHGRPLARHLAEMDNLKDGIHLRWTVQADPLEHGSRRATPCSAS